MTFLLLIWSLAAEPGLRISRPQGEVECGGFQAEGLTDQDPETYRCGAVVTWDDGGKPRQRRCRRQPASLGMAWTYDCPGPFANSNLEFHIRCETPGRNGVRSIASDSRPLTCTHPPQAQGKGPGIKVKR